MIEMIIQWAVPTICAMLMGAVIRAFKKVMKKLSDLTDMLIENDLAILWSELKGKTDEVIEQGWCSPEMLACIEQLFARYTVMKGNHGMFVKVETCRALPSTPPSSSKR